MNDQVQRKNGRLFNELRYLKLSCNKFGYAPGSVLFEMGNTKVLCSVTMQPGVPSFLRGKHRGWLTAEYSMLPSATKIRIQRESSSIKKNGRSLEISRLIGRSLRTIIDFETLGERTLIIDCDVLQADASTRVACITAAGLALKLADTKWLEKGRIKKTILKDSIAAVSVGLLKGQPLLDLDFSEDSIIDADINVVMTGSGKLIEIQGAAEGEAFSWQQFDKVKDVAIYGINSLLKESNRLFEKNILKNKQKIPSHNNTSLFSLKNRQL